MAEIPNDQVLSQLTTLNVSYRRKINLDYQSWEFSQAQTVEFLPQQTPDERRALIRKVSDLVRISVLQDIAATIPEIERTVSNPDFVRQLARSLGLE